MVLWSINPLVGCHNLHHAEPFNYCGKTPLKELEEERVFLYSLPLLLLVSILILIHKLPYLLLFLLRDGKTLLLSGCSLQSVAHFGASSFQHLLFVLFLIFVLLFQVVNLRQSLHDSQRVRWLNVDRSTSLFDPLEHG